MKDIEILERLGEGAYGVVYLVVNKTSNER
jgi:serine/threonine protein kinase